jgi:hypothetical protein
MVAQVGYSVVGRSRGRVAPCAVCTWHVETRSVGFLVEPQNQGRVAAPDLPRAGQRELEPQVTWRHRSCSGLGSGSWRRRTRGGTGALLGWAAVAGAAGHVAAPELTRDGQRELEPQDRWWPWSCSGGYRQVFANWWRWFLPVCPQNRWLDFLVEPQKPRWWRVSRFGPQNQQLWFGDLGLKIIATVSWFGPQNQVGFGLSVA